MLAEVRRWLRRERVLPPGAPLWVAVSGGVDSMVLWHILRALGHPCHVAHVDHGLRGSESDADAAFVRAHAEREGAVFRYMRVDPAAKAAEEGISVQMAARRLRYGWSTTLLREGPGLMALGHHRDDAVGTLLLHLLRGPGTRGWAGIPAVSPATGCPGGLFIRPLLDVTRDQVLAYAQEHGIPFREDSSNRDPKYLRNRIREELLPFLEELRPGAGRVLGRSVDLLRELSAAARLQVEQQLRSGVRDEAGVRHLPFSTLEGSPFPRLLLMAVLEDADFHPDVLERIITAVEERATGAVFTAGTWYVTVDREALLIGPAAGGFPTVIIQEKDVPGGVGPFTWEWTDAASVDVGQGMDVAWLDGDALRFPLELRTWREGDRMRPIGLKGGKAVSDILIDAKVPLAHKARTCVLVSHGTIVWLVGHRIAEGAQATDASTRVLRVACTGLP